MGASSDAAIESEFRQEKQLDRIEKLLEYIVNDIKAKNTSARIIPRM